MSTRLYYDSYVHCSQMCVLNKLLTQCKKLTRNNTSITATSIVDKPAPHCAALGPPCPSHEHRLSSHDTRARPTRLSRSKIEPFLFFIPKLLGMFCIDRVSFQLGVNYNHHYFQLSKLDVVCF